MDNLNRAEKVTLFCLATIDGLVDLGFLETEQRNPLLTDRGKEVYNELVKSGFSPTPKEIEKFMRGHYGVV